MAMLDFFKIEETKLEKENLEKEIKELQTEKETLLKEISQLTELTNSLQSTKISLDVQLKNREEFFVSTELKYIDSLDGISFENYAADMLQKLGYKAKVTKASQDNGGDILAEKDNIRTIFQCKNYSSTVGNKAIQEVYSAKDIYQCDQAIVITNNYFTNQAQHEASILNVQLWNRDYIKMLLYQVYQFDISHIDALKNIEHASSDIFSYDEDYEEADEILIEAIETAIELGHISTSMLQRKFKIGYSRAGTIIDQMETRGIITSYEGSRPRKVLITMEKWNELKLQMI